MCVNFFCCWYSLTTLLKLLVIIYIKQVYRIPINTCRIQLIASFLPTIKIRLIFSRAPKYLLVFILWLAIIFVMVERLGSSHKLNKKFYFVLRALIVRNETFCFVMNNFFSHFIVLIDLVNEMRLYLFCFRCVRLFTCFVLFFVGLE